MLTKRGGGRAFWAGGRLYKPQVMRRRELEGRVSSKRDSECDNRRESEKSAWLSTDQPNHFILFSKQQGVGGGIFFLFFFFCCCCLSCFGFFGFTGF